MPCRPASPPLPHLLPAPRSLPLSLPSSTDVSRRRRIAVGRDTQEQIEDRPELRRFVLVLPARGIVAGGPKSTASTDSPPRSTKPRPAPVSMTPPSASNRRRPLPPRVGPSRPRAPHRRLLPPRPRNRGGEAQVADAVLLSPAPAAAVRAPPPRRPASPALAGHSIVLRVSVRTSPPPLPSPSCSLPCPRRGPFSAAATARRRRISGDLMVQPAAPPCSSPSPLSSSTTARVQFEPNRRILDRHSRCPADDVC